MKFTISPELYAVAPEYIGGAIIGKVINSPTPATLQTLIDEECSLLNKTFNTTTLKERSGIMATRNAYKRAGKDPSRYRPASEQLARRVLLGHGLYTINTLVDIGNLVSIKHGLAVAVLDANAISGTDLRLGIGKTSEPYEAIGRGMLNIEHLPVLRDDIGGIATPTSDNVRTQVSENTKQVVFMINEYSGNKTLLDDALNTAQNLLTEFAALADSNILYF